MVRILPRRRVLKAAGGVGLLALGWGIFADTSDKLVPDDAEEYDWFGHAVAVDGTAAIVGSPHDDTENGPTSGSAYTYERSDGDWTQQAKLVPSDGDGQDEFGGTVAVAEGTALVGAYPDDEYAGSVYVFEHSGEGWNREATLTAADRESSESFGRALAVHGETALVGTPHDDPNGAESGSVSVFEQGDGNWTQQATLVPDDGDSEDEFGDELALSGGTAIVGVPLDSTTAGRSSGSAYVFRRDNSDWTQQAKLAPESEAGAFGASVALSGDTALVGDPQRNYPKGAADVFRRTEDGWSQQATLTADDSEFVGGFGSAVSLTGERALVGGYHNEAYATETGAAYVFERDGDGWTKQRRLKPDDDGEKAFGTAVSLSTEAALVGAYRDDSQGEDAGAVYPFEV